MDAQFDVLIHDQLVRYLAREISLEKFRDWFDLTAWDLQRTNNIGGRELAGEIELRLAEFSNAHWTEEELRQKFLPLVRLFVRNELSWGRSNTIQTTSSSNVTVSQDAYRGSGADIRVSVASG